MRAIQINHISILSYFSLIKPRETFLLAFIGICVAIVASGGNSISERFLLLIAALVLGSAGCNGLTNYLDRRVDAIMKRTQTRVLPQKLIDPPEKALYLVIPLIIIALVLSWFLNPLCFVVGMIGVLASSLWRKTITCTFFGIIAGCSPVLIGWFAFNTNLNWTIILILLMVVLWIPIHVWSVMIAKKEEYLGAGLNYFPIRMNSRTTVRIIFVLTVLLYSTSILLYLSRSFGIFYLIVANVIGITMVFASGNLMFNLSSKLSWRVYKLSSFPFLGLSFLSMFIDVLIK